MGESIALDGQNKDWICLSPNASFLYQPYPDIIDESLRIDLKKGKLKAGDTLNLKMRKSPPTTSIGIFSKDSLLLPHHYRHRIPKEL